MTGLLSANPTWEGVGQGMLVLAVVWWAYLAVRAIHIAVCACDAEKDDVSGFRVSASHFAERFGLIVIIALGESIVAVGAGLEGDALTRAVVVAALAAIALAIAQSWTYFDVVAIVAARKLAEAEGIARNRLARDSWGVLHGLLAAGIILTALGVKKTLGDVDSPLAIVPAAAHA